MNTDDEAPAMKPPRITNALDGPDGIPPSDTDSEGGETDVKSLLNRIHVLKKINHTLGRKLLGRGKGKRK